MFATSGRARLGYDVVGATSGADVLLMHAGVTDRRSWSSVVGRLSPEHRCVAFDARGFGESAHEAEDGWSPVADAVAVLDAAGVQRAVVVAASMGGAAAIDLALEHPDRVAALALIGPAVNGAPYPPVTEPRAAALERQVEEAERAGDLDALNRLEAWMWLDGPTAPEGRVGGAARELFLDMNATALRAADPGTPAEQPSSWPRLGALDLPTLVLVGALDMPDMQAVDRLLADRVGARLVWLDGVAHLPHLENDPRCLDELHRFAAAPR